MSATGTKTHPPKENLLRGTVSGVALRSGEGDEGEEATGPVMEGHFAVFNQWTEINSWEGNFLEMFAPGAFKRTIKNNGSVMKVLFQHGYDYMIGDKPLGPIRALEEDSDGDHVPGVAGAWYEVPLLDAAYVREEVLPGLEGDLYGASFRFRVIREEINEDPGVSDHNPHGLPERVVKEAQVVEFGPVTFPAYEGASAGCRSLEAGELVAQAALERMERQDSQRSHNLAARFASRSEVAEPDTSAEKTVEAPEAAPDDPAETEVEETEETQPEDSGDDNAPPQVRPETESHSDRGAREQERLYGAATAPSWRL